MRIAFILDQFPALSEVFILDQITGLIDRGHEVDIYADRPRLDMKVHPDVTKYGLIEQTYYHDARNTVLSRSAGLSAGMFFLGTRHPLRTLKLFRSMKLPMAARELAIIAAQVRTFAGREYDILHCHFGSNGVLAAFARDIGTIKGKLVTTFHGGVDVYSYVREGGPGIYRDLFAQGDLFMYVSHFVGDIVMSMGCDSRRAVLHRNSVDMKKFTFQPRAPRDGEPVRLLTVARLVEMKGVEYSIRAVAALARRYPHISYQIVGDGPLRPRLQELIDQLGVGHVVKLLGWKSQDELRQLYAEAHLFVLASVTAANGDMEGQPVVLLEALAMGLPVVCTRHSGSPEAVVDGQSGFLVPERDVNALADRLEYLLLHPEMWPALGRAGRAHIEAEHDMACLNDRLVELYRAALEGVPDKRAAIEIAPNGRFA